MSRLPDMVCIPHRVPACRECMGLARARRTQTALDAAVGDAEHAERLLDPLQVRELTPAEAAAEWPDTVPMDSALLSWMEGTTR